MLTLHHQEQKKKSQKTTHVAFAVLALLLPALTTETSKSLGIPPTTTSAPSGRVLPRPGRPAQRLMAPWANSVHDRRRIGPPRKLPQNYRRHRALAVSVKPASASPHAPIKNTTLTSSSQGLMTAIIVTTTHIHMTHTYTHKLIISVLY